MSESMSPDERELQQSSEAFLTELSRLDAMERRKRDLPPHDDARVALAREIEEVAMGLLARSRYQARLAEMQNLSLGGGEPEPRTPALILNEWREAERALRDARAAMERALDVAERLRDEHRRAVRQHGAD